MESFESFHDFSRDVKPCCCDLDASRNSTCDLCAIQKSSDRTDWETKIFRWLSNIGCGRKADTAHTALFENKLLYPYFPLHVMAMYGGFSPILGRPKMFRPMFPLLPGGVSAREGLSVPCLWPSGNQTWRWKIPIFRWFSHSYSRIDIFVQLAPFHYQRVSPNSPPGLGILGILGILTKVYRWHLDVSWFYSQSIAAESAEQNRKGATFEWIVKHILGFWYQEMDRNGRITTNIPIDSEHL